MSSAREHQIEAAPFDAAQSQDAACRERNHELRAFTKHLCLRGAQTLHTARFRSVRCYHSLTLRLSGPPHSPGDKERVCRYTNDAQLLQLFANFYILSFSVQCAKLLPISTPCYGCTLLGGCAGCVKRVQKTLCLKRQPRLSSSTTQRKRLWVGALVLMTVCSTLT